MSQCYFGFMFLEKHTGMYIAHTLSYHLLTQGQILLDFLLLSPLRDLEKLYSIRE